MKLYRQKEQLKKDILKKRVVLEKELQIEIQQELSTELANRSKQEEDKPNPTVKEEDSTSSVGSPSKKRYISFHENIVLSQLKMEK